MNMDAIFNSFPVLKSDRLLLKKVEAVDLDDVFSIYDNDKVFEYCGIIPKHNKASVEKMIGHFGRDFGKRTRIKWGIYTDKGLTGIIEAMEFNQKVNMAVIGYFLAEAHWGKGIAGEALGLVTRFLFEEGGVNRLQAEVMPGNHASKQVLLKNGYIMEGTLRQAALWSGKGIVDLEIYGLLREDFFAG
ncbi:GNAT family N-acetyltransferase [Peribacillus sp. SCS-37]|uniref:GNAT family N-acetyltransferase n=1 Tax=Paraperibacillus esterisolvens TaxID=3115296 RepID=UPI003906401E